MDAFNEIRWRAFALARTGRFRDCGSVESALSDQGYVEVHDALNNESVRAHLNAACNRDREVEEPSQRERFSPRQRTFRG